MEIKYDRYSLIIDGHRTFIRSGAMHYFRLPSPELWKDRLFKLKAAGYNTVDLYFCWGYHSPAPGVYDFTGVRDVRRLLEITRELGLYVIARPGPYINAEYSGGGFPGWLLAKRDLPLRNRREGAFVWSDEYMAYVREWWTQIIPILKTTPNLILMQIENEYATLEVEPDYMQALYKMTRDMGVTAPLFHNDLYVAGLYEDIVDIYSFDNYSVTQFETDWRTMPEVFQVVDRVEENLRPFCQNRPLMAAELQAGWFGAWKGYKYEKITELLGREHIGISTRSLLGQGLTLFNHYKAIGGTNWEYTGSIETYTSYDFGAPISEAGLNTERLFESKAINYFLQSFDLTTTDRLEDFPLHLSHRDCFYTARALRDTPHACWLFLRNLTYEPQALTVGETYSVTVHPFEALILPYRIPLQCGYELEFSTAEVLYQNRHSLVIKADRPLTVCLYTQVSAALFSVGHPITDVELLSSVPGFVTFCCPELPERELRHLQIGDLSVFLLGAHLVDTFWVEEDGGMVAGPEMRLSGGAYGLSGEHREYFRIAPDAQQAPQVQVIPSPPATPLEIPLLRPWRIFNDAPELTREYHLAAQFRPIWNGLPDFDANGFYEGSAWYRLPLGAKRPDHVEIDARHIWAAFLNGRFLGEGHQLILIHGLANPDPVQLPLPEADWRNDAENELLIFVNGLGHPKGFHDDAQTPQGLLRLRVDGQDRTADVSILPEVYSRRAGQPAIPPETLSGFAESPIVRMETRFSLPSIPQAVVPWGLKLQDVDFDRINIYLNHALVGRYWRQCRRQEVFYLPSGLLREEPDAVNQIELILINFNPFIERARLAIHPQQVTLHPYGVFTRSEAPLHQSQSSID